MAGPTRPEVRAHIGKQVDVQCGDLALLRRSQCQPLHLIPAMVGTLQRLAAGFGVLDWLAQLLGHRKGNELFGRDLQLAAEAAADIRCDHPDLVFQGCSSQSQ